MWESVHGVAKKRYLVGYGLNTCEIMQCLCRLVFSVPISAETLCVYEMTSCDTNTLSIVFEQTYVLPLV
jgi:hypothetical protein